MMDGSIRHSGGGGCPVGGPLESVLAVVVVLHGLLDLGARVHDEGPVLHHPLTQRLPAHQREPQRRASLVPHAHPVVRAQHEAVVRAAGGPTSCGRTCPRRR